MNGILVFIEMKPKKNQNGPLKKNSFSSSVNSQFFFMKISWIGPWVGRIDWCEGHCCGLIYMVVKLSNISSKTAWKHKKSIFRPHNHISWASPIPFASINSTNPRNNTLNFPWKNIKNWRSWKMSFFFWVGHLFLQYG